jgi:hypothetical protein
MGLEKVGRVNDGNVVESLGFYIQVGAKILLKIQIFYVRIIVT